MADSSTDPLVLDSDSGYQVEVLHETWKAIPIPHRRIRPVSGHGDRWGPVGRDTFRGWAGATVVFATVNWSLTLCHLL
jgi:hypothetical protein